MSFLVAIDLSAPSRHAIEVAALLARATGIEPLLLHVAERNPTLRQLADLYDLAEPLRALGSSPCLRIVEGEPATCICEQALARRCTFVLMGTRGQRDSSTHGPGSVARRVLACARVPVVAVRPQPGPRAFAPETGDTAVALVESGASSPTAAHMAALLVEATHGTLVRLPAWDGWQEGLPVLDGAAPAPTHLVLSVDPDQPAPPWVERILQRAPHPVVLVSNLPFGGGVPDATPWTDPQPGPGAC